MSRKLNTLMLLGALVVCMLVVLAGCFDPDQVNQHSPAHIGTDPFTGGFDPATGRELVNGVLTVVAPPKGNLNAGDLEPAPVLLPPGAQLPAGCSFNGRVTRGCTAAQIKSICADGTGSCSTGSGTCSGHGGVCATL